MKKQLLLAVLCLSAFSYAQVGINTNNPRNTFHVDGAKDNNPTGTPSTVQQANDVIITSSGNVGIGTTNPATRLEINNGSTTGAIKIVDGSQGVDKVLVSDANGVGSWRTPASIKPTITGVFPSPAASINSDGSNTPLYSGVYIDLSQGKWVVNAGLTLFNSSTATRYWLHSYISTSTTAIQQNGFTHLGPAGTGTSYAGVITNSGSSGNDNTLNFMTGSSVINVTANTVRVYLLIENKPADYWRYPSGAQENYFYAIPIN